jgi:hypothetical protein
MAAALSVMFGFPSVVFTVLFLVALIYWVFVVLGGISVNVLGHGTDGLADGHADALGGGHADAGDLGGGHADTGDLGGDDAGSASDGGDAEVPGDGHSGLGAILAALELRSAPATVVLSLIITFAWLICTTAMQWLAPGVPGGLLLPFGLGLLVAAPVLALIPTSLVIRPLKRVFKHHEPIRNRHLVGKVCRIRTGSVTEKFGEAVLDHKGAELVLRVRAGAEEALKRGEEAVIVDFDAEREVFVVASLRDVLGSDPQR